MKPQVESEEGLQSMIGKGYYYKLVVYFKFISQAKPEGSDSLVYKI